MNINKGKRPKSFLIKIMIIIINKWLYKNVCCWYSNCYFSTIAFDFISLQIGWSFSYFDILTGYFTGFIVLKIARYGSEKVGIISVICYLLGTLFTPILTYYAFWGQSLTLMIAIQLAIGQFSNLFSLVFIAIGAMTAYITSKN